MNDRLESIRDEDRMIRVLAIDHRDSLLALLDAGAKDEAVVSIKADLVAASAGSISGVMLDPEYGMHPDVLARVPIGVGIIAAREAQGYLADESVSHTTLLDGWSSVEAKELGAACMKLLALWDGKPNDAQRAVIDEATSEAHASEMALVLEPLPRGLPSSGPWVLDWVAAHADSDADLFKVPYPGSRSLAEELTGMLPAPWVLLSAGAPFPTFKEQLEAALAEGASGYIAGRAVWREAAVADAARRIEAIETIVRPRLAALAELGRR